MPTIYPAPIFTVVRSPWTYGHLAMYRSTLDRFLVGTEPALPIQIRIDRYLARWRRRAAWLSTDTTLDPKCETPRLPVGLVARALPALLPCPPPFAECVPRSRICDRPSLCPSCWARRVASTWSGLDRGVFAGGAAPPGLTMVVRAATYAVPAQIYDEEGTTEPGTRPIGAMIAYRLDRARPGADKLGRRRKADLPSRNAELTRFRRDPWVVAGLDATTADLDAVPTAADGLARWDAYSGGWQFVIHQVLFGNGAVPAPLLTRLREAPGIGGRLGPGRAEVRVVAAPTRRAVAEAVATALPYPAEVMLRCAERCSVREYLGGWRGLRPAVTFGDFRKLHA